MAIILNNKTKRNLQEQVAYLTESFSELLDINKIGIRVIGAVETEDDLPDIETTPGLEYGDAFLVGSPGDYEAYILTRPFGEETTAHWFNVGQISMQGPQGEQGSQGEQGVPGPSTKWYVSTNNPTVTTDYNEFDSWLNTTDGSVFQLRNNAWNRVGNIRGPVGAQGPQGSQGIQGEQGSQGIQGPVGDPGSFVHIAGKVDTVNQLPSPSVLDDMTKAYLVGNENLLYIQVGNTPATATWNNLGALNVATYVTVNGDYVGMWDSDTKVDKKTTASTVYTVDGNGNQVNVPYARNSYSGNTIVLRNDNGEIVTNYPTGNYSAVNLGYPAMQFAKGEFEKSLNLLDKYNRDATRTTETDWYYILDFTNVPNFNGNLTISTSQTVYQFVIYNIEGGDRYTQSGSYLNQWTFNLRNYTQNDKVLLRIIKGDSTFDNINIMLNNGTTKFDYQPYNGRLIHTKDLEPVLLWSNANPNNAFAPTSISIPTLNKYKYIVVKYKRDKDDAITRGLVKVINELNTAYYLFSFRMSAGLTYTRIFTIYGDSIYFANSYANTSESNNFCIPLEIYGTNLL